MPKVTLRKAILARRLALPAMEKFFADDAIQDAFLATPEYGAADSVALYFAANNEVSTEKIISHALMAGKRLFAPAVEGDEMLFRRVTERDDLVNGRFGIRQPSAACAAVDPEEIELLVVPGVGFDLYGQRDRKSVV